MKHLLRCKIISACRLLPLLSTRKSASYKHAFAASQAAPQVTRGKVNTVKCNRDTDKRVHLPLVELPVAATVSAQSLLEWYEHQQADLQSFGQDLSQTMVGPSASDLQAELDWLLDDSIADFEGSQQGARGKTKWRQLRQHNRQRAVGAAQLRLDFDSLKSRWRRRVHDRVPLQYLTGSAHWRDLVLAVGPGVLIPRPETELLIDFAEEAMAEVPDSKDGVWADLGTGSGALSIALARSLSDRGRVFAVDASEEAAAWAQLNVRRYALESRVQVLLGSWFDPLHEYKGQLSGVLCNPPYIASDVVPTLQAEVARHEPWSALDGGRGTGSAMLLDICRAAVGMLRAGGFLALETGGDAQAEEIATFMSELSDEVGGGSTRAYANVMMRKDLRGVARFVTGFRAS